MNSNFRYNIYDLIIAVSFYIVLKDFIDIVLILVDWNTPTSFLFANLVMGFSMVLPIYLLTKLKYKKSFVSVFGLQIYKIKDNIRRGMWAFIVFGILLALSHYMFNRFGLTEGSLSKQDVYYFMLATLMAPVTEEIAFRGFMQSVFSGYLGNILGILITSLMFVSLHTQYYGNFTSQFTLLLLSVIMGIVRLKYKSLQPSIAVHFLNNFTSCLRLF